MLLTKEDAVSPLVELAPGYSPFDPCSANVSHHCMFKFCSALTWVPSVNSFVCACVCVRVHKWIARSRIIITTAGALLDK